MRAYEEADEEALRARELLQDWLGEGFLTEAQARQLESETVCELRHTKGFLRVVLFFFTLVIVVAVVGLLFALLRPAGNGGGVFLFFGLVTYGAAEYAVSEYKLYRYGIEEALLFCAVGLFCAGIQLTGLVIPPALAGTGLYLWIWLRFGIPYAFPAALLFYAFLPGHWITVRESERIVIVLGFVVGLFLLRSRRETVAGSFLEREYSFAEALLWLGMYLALNLQLTSMRVVGLWSGQLLPVTDFKKSFYWATWGITWLLPWLILWQGIRARNRFLTGVGALTAVLTLLTNKAYLGWARQTWDPMLLGAVLILVALWLRRKLESGADGVRSGFTARRLSGRESKLLEAASVAFGMTAVHSPPPAQASDFQFGGGDSGGGGASADY